MDELEKIIEICVKYKNKELDINQFQRRLQEVHLPELCSREICKDRENADNYLEATIYGYGESEKRERSVKVADRLIVSATMEQKRLADHTPYAV